MCTPEVGPQLRPLRLGDTVGIDTDAASDLFAILANREHRLPTVIASQTGPAHWVAELPDRVAADSIVNRLANHARTINLGQLDMRKLRHEHAQAATDYGIEHPRTAFADRVGRGDERFQPAA